MGKCTAEQAVKAFEYWLGYYEKASSSYSTTRDKSAFEKNKGANNYTYAGYICGINGPAAAWCAMQVSLSIYEACGNSKTDAKSVMWNVWPYTACNQLYDAAPSNMKGRRGAWTPKPGDVIVFTQNGIRTHTGMVYSVDSKNVYTYEGNTSNMCAKRSYALTSTYIYGYVRPNYATSNSGTSSNPPDTSKTPAAPAASTGTTSSSGSGSASSANIKNFQTWLNKAYAGGLVVDGEYGPKTKKAAIKAYQRICNSLFSSGLVVDGVWGPLSKRAIAKHPLKKGAKQKDLIIVLQGMLQIKGYSPENQTGVYGTATVDAVKAFQKAKGLLVDGEAGQDTFAKLFS